MKQDASVDLNYLLEKVESSALKQSKTELILVSNKPFQLLDTCFSHQWEDQRKIDIDIIIFKAFF